MAIWTFEGVAPGMRAYAFAAALLCIMASSPITALAADSFTVGEALEDTKEYFTAPVRWDAEDWLFFGGAIAAVAASHEFDGRVRAHFATGSNAVLDGRDKNSLRDAAPTLAIIAGTWATAGFFRDRDGYRETWSLLEAGVFSTITADVFS